MKLELLKYNDETGVCELDVDEEAKQMLMELGFNALLRKALEVYENEREEDGSV